MLAGQSVGAATITATYAGQFVFAGFIKLNLPIFWVMLITRLLADLRDAGLCMNDLSTRQSSLEEIFVSLVQSEQEERA